MTTQEIERLRGKVATLEIVLGDKRNPQPIRVLVSIKDGRTVYGRQEVLIEPFGAALGRATLPEDFGGQAWVSADRVKVRDR